MQLNHGQPGRSIVNQGAGGVHFDEKFWTTLITERGMNGPHKDTDGKTLDVDGKKFDIGGEKINCGSPCCSDQPRHHIVQSVAVH